MEFSQGRQNFRTLELNTVTNRVQWNRQVFGPIVQLKFEYDYNIKLKVLILLLVAQEKLFKKKKKSDNDDTVSTMELWHVNKTNCHAISSGREGKSYTKWI